MRSSILNQRSGVIIIIMIVIIIIIILIIIIITIFGFFASLVREGKKEHLIHSFNAPINVNPVRDGGGGECGQGVGIWQILKFFDQIPQGRKRKVNQKCQKSPHRWGKI